MSFVSKRTERKLSTEPSSHRNGIRFATRSEPGEDYHQKTTRISYSTVALLLPDYVLILLNPAKIRPPREISVPPLSSPRAKNPKTKAAVRQRLPLSSPRAASKVSDTPSQRTPLASPRGTAKQVATSSEETPNRSNVRGVRGGVNVNSYREPKPVLSSSDEEEFSKQKRRGRRDVMSLQRTDEMPIGKLLLFLSSCIAKWA